VSTIVKAFWASQEFDELWDASIGVVRGAIGQKPPPPKKKTNCQRILLHVKIGIEEDQAPLPRKRPGDFKKRKICHNIDKKYGR